MAKPKAKEAAAKYLDEILALLPEDKRESVKTGLTASEAALENLGEHVLRQDEFSRLAAETAAERQKADEKYNANLQWYQQSQAELAKGSAAVAELERISKERSTAAASTDNATLEAQLQKATASFIPRDEAQRIFATAMNQRDLQVVDFVANVVGLAQEHNLNFKEMLDTKALMKLAAEKKMTLPDAYREMSTEKREAKQKADEDARIDRIRKEERAKIQSELSARGPYPMPDSSQDISPLSGINIGKTGSKSLAVDAAVKEYEEKLFASR